MSQKKRKKKKRCKNRKPIQLRNRLAEFAHLRQRSGGGIHKDRRLKRVTRKSWKKDWDL